MADFPKYHGITLAANSWVENLVIESLGSDPSSFSTAGRIWFNDSDKRLRFAGLDDSGSIVVQDIATGGSLEDFKTLLASTVAGEGSALVGYDGHTGSNELLSVSSGTVEDSLDALVDAIDSDRKDENDWRDQLASETAGDGSGLIGYTGSSGSDDNVSISAGTVESAINTLVNELDSAVQATTDLQSTVESDYLSKVTTTAQTVASDVEFSGGVTVKGDLTVEGETTTVDSETVEISDNIIELNSNYTSGDPTENAGLSVLRGDEGSLTFLRFNESSDAVEVAVWDDSLDPNDDGTAEGDFAMREVADKTWVDAEIQAALDGQDASSFTYDGHTGSNGEFSVSEGDLETSLDTIVQGIDTEIADRLAGDQAIQDELDATQTALGSMVDDSGSYVAPSDTNYLDSTSDLSGAITALDTQAKANADAISDEVDRATGVEGDLDNLDTTEKSNLVQAINEVQATASSADSGVRSDVNGQRHRYSAGTAAKTHSINHGLDTQYPMVNVWIEGDDGVFRQDIVAVEETDSNNITVSLTESRIIKVLIMAGEDI